MIFIHHMILQYMRECSMAFRILHARVRPIVAKQLDHGKHWLVVALARIHQDIPLLNGVRIRAALEQLAGERHEVLTGDAVEIAEDNIPEQRVAARAI